MTALDIKNENSIFTTAGLYKTRIEATTNVMVPISRPSPRPRSLSRTVAR